MGFAAFDSKKIRRAENSPPHSRASEKRFVEAVAAVMGDAHALFEEE